MCAASTCSAHFRYQLEAIHIESGLFWLGVIGLGAAHAFEPDHMAAVSTFVAGRPTPREAASFGCKWALGHGFSLLLLGGALAALKLLVHQPALFASGVLDKIVGLALLGLGLWMMIQLRTGVVFAAHADWLARGFTWPRVARTYIGRTNRRATGQRTPRAKC